MADNNILQYESTVWKTADLLIASGIKQSDFPKFMMPFFALIMVESRFVRMIEEVKSEFVENNYDLNLLFEEIKDLNQGYNKFLVEKNKTLKDLCRSDKTFEIDFDAYLKGFDDETKDLLGVEKGNEEEKYLDISGICGLLKKKRILLAFTKAWSEIDLKPFNNSEITTLEEHIKRKWADISAETSGEQYTPDDVINLISEIVASKITDKNGIITIYDPTCGGGNMLFGVEDRISKILGKLTATYGQDWNDALFALAKIESRFREDSFIEYGNTLTDLRFHNKVFDVSVSNVPFGVDWKGFEKDIRRDKTGRFKALPAVSDGQLLFLQHLISKMDDDGIAVSVHNGSTLFSGDAGSGESEIRKWMFDKDIIEAVIQLPTDEFFNTNIFTYLWVLNKNKPIEKKDKVIMIDASSKFAPLSRNKGKKRKEVTPQQALEIVEILNNFRDNEIAKVFHKSYFYFNKQAIMLTNVDENGKTIESLLPTKKNKDGEIVRESSICLKDLIRIEQTEENKTLIFAEFHITEPPSNEYRSLLHYFDEIKAKLANFDYKEKDLKVYTKEATYWYDEDKETLIREKDGKLEELGCGKIVIKSKYNKPTKTRPDSITVTVELTPDYQKDYEIIEFDFDETINRQNIENFMAKYITKPFEYLDNVVGVEINFNKLFYKPETLRPLSEILTDLENIENQLKDLEKDLNI
ncbi:MAG: N-6 DNA methylase [Candidatus Cloacimonetes bacterium]|nr:N-6 DNA methylase [Candidatus Cloacimonadota bacterium]